MNRCTLQAVLLVAALLTQGCSGLLTSDQPARSTYLLMPLNPSATAAANPEGPSLVIDVAAVPGLDTDRILALDGDARLNHYGNARWPDHLPEVLSSVLQRSLESSGQFDSVRTGTRTHDDEWLLQLEVREFYGIQDASGATASVRVRLSGSIQCNAGRQAMAIGDSTRVGEQRLSDVVAAHQAGLDASTRQLLERIKQSCGTGTG